MDPTDILELMRDLRADGATSVEVVTPDATVRATWPAGPRDPVPDLQIVEIPRPAPREPGAWGPLGTPPRFPKRPIPIVNSNE